MNEDEAETKIKENTCIVDDSAGIEKVKISEVKKRNYKKEEDFASGSNDKLVNGCKKVNGHENKEITLNHANEVTLSNNISAEQLEKIINENTNSNFPMQMMTLGSNNNVFMTSRTLHVEPIYTTKELPKFLQESLAESLSKISIADGDSEKTVKFIDFENERHLPDLTAIITNDLSEPYSIYTYRYFLHNWPQLSFLAYHDEECVGAIVCKLDQHRKNVWRGYIAMLVVRKDFRRFKIGSKLVQKAIRRMVEQGCDEVVLETEVTNKAALNLYENLGFVRDKRLLRYYLNGVDAWRLKLWLV